MKNLSLKLGVLTLLITVFATGVYSASAQSETGQTERQQKMQAHREEMEARREQMDTIFETGDYDTFMALTNESCRMAKEMDEEKFNVMAEAHKLMEAGDKEGARELMDEAGIKGPMHGKHRGMRPPMPDLSDEDKAKLKEAHELMKSGDEEGAQAIFDELGIERPQKRGWHGFKPNTDE